MHSFIWRRLYETRDILILEKICHKKFYLVTEMLAQSCDKIGAYLLKKNGHPKEVTCILNVQIFQTSWQRKKQNDIKLRKVQKNQDSRETGCGC